MVCAGAMGLKTSIRSGSSLIPARYFLKKQRDFSRGGSAGLIWEAGRHWLKRSLNDFAKMSDQIS